MTTESRIVWALARKDGTGSMHENGCTVAGVFDAMRFSSPMRAAAERGYPDGMWEIRQYRMTMEEME